MITYLKSNDAVFEFTKQPSHSANIPKVTHEDGTLNILSLLENFNQLMSEKCLAIPPISNQDLENYTEQFQDFARKLHTIDIDFDDMYSKLNEFKSTLKDNPKEQVKSSVRIPFIHLTLAEDDSLSGNSVLAMPLQLTPENNELN